MCDKILCRFCGWKFEKAVPNQNKEKKAEKKRKERELQCCCTCWCFKSFSFFSASPLLTPSALSSPFLTLHGILKEEKRKVSSERSEGQRPLIRTCQQFWQSVLLYDVEGRWHVCLRFQCLPSYILNAHRLLACCHIVCRWCRLY